MASSMSSSREALPEREIKQINTFLDLMSDNDTGGGTRGDFLYVCFEEVNDKRRKFSSCGPNDLLQEVYRKEEDHPARKGELARNILGNSIKKLIKARDDGSFSKSDDRLVALFETLKEGKKLVVSMRGPLERAQAYSLCHN